VFSFRELASRKIPFEVETNYELPKMVAGGKRPTIPDDCPRDFRKLMEWCWSQQASQRPTFVDIVQFFEKKGLLDDALAGETDDTIAKLEAVEKKTDELRLTKEKLERQWEATERRADREKDARAENERATEELEKVVIKEREKIGATERQLQTMERKMNMEKDQQSERYVTVLLFFSAFLLAPFELSSSPVLRFSRSNVILLVKRRKRRMRRSLNKRRRQPKRS
jgi:hypothetical protein